MIKVDHEEQVLICDDRRIELTGCQFKLFDLLYSNLNCLVLSRSLNYQMMGVEAKVTNTVAVHVWQLRNVFRKHKVPLVIIARRGLGLKMVHQLRGQ